jgi:hypothetical protein
MLKVRQVTEVTLSSTTTLHVIVKREKNAANIPTKVVYIKKSIHEKVTNCSIFKEGNNFCFMISVP